MAKKKKNPTHKGRIRKKADAVSIQISAHIRGPKHVKLSHDLLMKMIQEKALMSEGYWDPKSKSVVDAREGPDPSGVKLRITSWRNPSRKGTGKLRRNRAYGSQAERWGSLRAVLGKARITIK